MSAGISGTYQFRTVDDVLDVMDIIRSTFPELGNSELGVWELMLNAIEHGNLEIGFGKKTELLEEGTILDEIETRLQSRQYGRRQARLELTGLNDKIVFAITDEGPGFDWRRFVTKKMGDIEGLHGRGILMAKSAFLSLEYVGAGNKVIAEIRREAANDDAK